jgi:hypothetical protein
MLRHTAGRTTIVDLMGRVMMATGGGPGSDQRSAMTRRGA